MNFILSFGSSSQHCQCYYSLNVSFLFITFHRVNSLSPGPIEDTEGFDKLGGKSPMAQRMLQAIPLARFGTRTDIANAALFLVSPAASYVTGTTMVVDGGAWMTVAVPMSHARKLMPGSKL